MLRPWSAADHPVGDRSLVVLQDQGDWQLVDAPMHPNRMAGCIRTHDEVMERVLARLPLGTPAAVRARPGESDSSVGGGIVRVVG